MNTLTVSDITSAAEAETAESVIELENVSVHYRVPRERVSGIKEYTIRWMQRRLSYENFGALNNLSLSIPKGEVFGVIGRNGSGKSTLLKVIARVLVPTQGRVVLRGRVAPLLELGAGFHPELTGRENVFLNSALLGRSRAEVETLMPEIIDFAEIGDFLDAPLRTYSTGMVARLGFSVATCVRPQILLVDEVLSVGDSRFQQKCLNRMYSFQAQGSTIVIVSHSMATIESFCTRAVWLNAGRAEAQGSVGEVIRQYIARMEGSDRGHSHHLLSSEDIDSQPALDEEAPGEGHSPAVGEEQTAEPEETWQAKGPFTALTEIEKTYPAEGVLNYAEGSLYLWLKFDSRRTFQDAIIFHSDDSRYVLYVGSYYLESQSRYIRMLIARAGGNRQVIDTYFGSISYPEVKIPMDSEETVHGSERFDDQWHLIVMTWDGYPEGTLAVYLDGHLIDQRDYDRRYDNGQPLAQELAVGMRPREWRGEIVKQEDGTVIELRPESTLSIHNSNMEIQDLRVYPRALKPKEVQNLYVKRILFGKD